MKKLVYLIVLIAAFGLIVAGCIPMVPPAEQSDSVTLPNRNLDINVPGDYTTIQAAINAASSGDTIIVAAGTYNENVTIDKSVILQGASGVILQGSSGTGNGFLIKAANITISDFEVTNFAIGIRTYGDFSNFGNLTISNVNNHNNSVNGVLIVYDIFDTVTFENSQINSNNQNGIGIANGAQITLLQITNTTISNNGVSIEYSGLYIATSGTTLSNLTASNLIMSGNKGCGILIDNNSSVSNASFSDTNITGSDVNFSVRFNAQVNGLTFQNCQLSNSPTNHGLWIRGGAVNNLNAQNTSFSNNRYQGFYVSDSGVLTNATIQGGSIEHNDWGFLSQASTVTNLTVSGVTIKNNTYGSGLTVDSGIVNGFTVENCTFQANAWEHLDIGLGWKGILNISNVNITGNTFAAGPWCSIYVHGGATFGNDDIEIHLNDFVSGQWGVFSDNTVSVDATCNWWGDDSGPRSAGPGTGDAVSANVLYNPWLTEDSTLVYTADPQPTTFVVLEAVLSDLTPTGISGMEVDFYLDEFLIGGATTDSNGLARIELGSYAVGVYEVYASTICDLTSLTEYLAVYDLSEGSGFITGGGWIDSPPGAYIADETLSGKASFGFVSKYKKGQSTPTGNTEFQFKAGNLNFHSDSYNWLVVAGDKAMYKGTGTVNGADDFGFMIFAIDSDHDDKFRIKIWDRGDDGTVIYDNGCEGPDGTVLGGGQIIIHKGK